MTHSRPFLKGSVEAWFYADLFSVCEQRDQKPSWQLSNFPCESPSFLSTSFHWKFPSLTMKMAGVDGQQDLWNMIKSPPGLWIAGEWVITLHYIWKDFFCFCGFISTNFLDDTHKTSNRDEILVRQPMVRSNERISVTVNLSPLLLQSAVLFFSPLVIQPWSVKKVHKTILK